MATETGNRETTARLLAALAREGLASVRRDGDGLELRVGAQRVRVGLREGADSRWLHPGDLDLSDGPDANAHKLFEGLELPGSAAGRRDVARLLSSAAQYRSVQRPLAPRPHDPLAAWDRAVVSGDSWDPCDRAVPGVRVKDALSWLPEATAQPDVQLYALPADTVTGEIRVLETAGAGEAVVAVHEAATDTLFEAIPAARHLRSLGPASAVGPPGEVALEGWSNHLVLSLPGAPVAARDAVALSRWVLMAAPEGLFPVRDLEAIEVLDEPGLGAVVRESTAERLPSERLVGCAALLEAGEDGRPLLLGLPGADRPERFLGAWVGRLLDGVVALLDQGLAVPASGWGLVARYQAGRLQGFAVRDLGRTRVHLATLATLVADARLSAGSTAAVESSRDLAVVLHQHVVQRHIADLVHGLGLGEAGWRIVRDKVDLRLAGSEAHAVWTALMVPHTCALRSRLEGRTVVRDAQNPIA